MIKIIDYWAPWCGPCKSFNPILNEINDAYDNIILEKVNVMTDEGKQLATEKGIKAIPYVEIEKDGVLVEKFTGFKSRAKLVELIEKYV